MKRALLLNAICPKIGGVLIRGEKGTAKSTAVRSLAALLPALDGSQRTMPLVTLPLSATEDQVIGSLDFESAIKTGKPRFRPGLIFRAHRGILYLDEVNLLDDHLVDVILDAVASGVNIVEREGFSFQHPAQIILVGTMNPEEGELRPQLLDRFGLVVEVQSLPTLEERMELLRRREAFEADPLGFQARWQRETEILRQKIRRAREIFPTVELVPERLEEIVNLSLQAQVAGHRGDLVTALTARALAAWEGRRWVTAEDVVEAAELALRHRQRAVTENQPEKNPSQEDQNRHRPPLSEKPPASRDTSSSSPKGSHRENQPPAPERGERMEGGEVNENPSCTKGAAETSPKNYQDGLGTENPVTASPGRQTGKERIFPIGQPYPLRLFERERDRLWRRRPGRRFHTLSQTRRGRYIRSTILKEGDDLALDATIRAAAPHQLYRRRDGLALVIENSDLRQKVRERKTGHLLVFLVDASGSMGAQERMIEVKGAVFSLLLDAYQKRDQVSLVVFRGQEAQVLLPPTSSAERAHRLLQELPTGGKTPLAAGLWQSYQLIQGHFYRAPERSPWLILVTDGRANVSLGSGRPLEEALAAASIIRADPRIKSLVVDVEKNGLLSFGQSQRLAHALGADYFLLGELRAQELVLTLRAAIRPGQR
ncbi:MAG: VWA domain-containing protein [Firmicutes bacterium]|nr:VWA domain-containing protein [Bacillota bacterium]